MSPLKTTLKIRKAECVDFFYPYAFYSLLKIFFIFVFNNGKVILHLIKLESNQKL